MKYLFVALLVLVFLPGGSGGQLPSDLIKHQSAPVAISLQNVMPSSAKAIDQANANLSKTPKWQMVDLGYLASEPASTIQGNETITPALLTFSGKIPEIPTSVGNVSGNATVLNDTIVFW